MTDKKWYEDLNTDELKAALDKLERQNNINIQIMQSLDRQISILEGQKEILKQLIKEIGGTI